MVNTCSFWLTRLSYPASRLKLTLQHLERLVGVLCHWVELNSFRSYFHSPNIFILPGFHQHLCTHYEKLSFQMAFDRWWMNKLI